MAPWWLVSLIDKLTNYAQVVAFFEQPGLKEYHDQLWAATDPSRNHAPLRIAGHGPPSVTALLPRIQLARRLIVEVREEGRFILKIKMNLNFEKRRLSLRCCRASRCIASTPHREACPA